MTTQNKILQINRHLFSDGTSKKKQGIAELGPKGFDSPLALVANCVSEESAPAYYAENEEVKNRAEILSLKLSLQGKGYRSGKPPKTNVPSPSDGVLYLSFIQPQL